MDKKILKIIENLDQKKKKLEKQFQIDISTMYYNKDYKNLNLSITVSNNGHIFINFQEDSGKEFSYDLDFERKTVTEEGKNSVNYLYKVYKNEDYENKKYYNFLKKVIKVLNDEILQKSTINKNNVLSVGEILSKKDTIN